MTLDIRKIVSRRSDLSTFLVHLTRDAADRTARDVLRAILADGVLRATSLFGQAKRRLEAGGHAPDSQKCVCFTETPLEYTHLLLADIENRDFRFRPYGVAITKRIGRNTGINPVWYLDITPGHDWLAANIDSLLNKTLANGEFSDPDIEAIAPFIEQMGTRYYSDGSLHYRKEFWWEREWRYAGGNYQLPTRILGLCPEDEIDEFTTSAKDSGLKARFIDPRWGMERIIAHLAGFSGDDTNIL